MTTKKGFTLIELLVVIAIIGILSTIAVIALQSTRAKSRDAKRIADIKQVQTALEMYYGDVTHYPYDVGAPGALTGTLGAGNFVCLSSANANGFGADCGTGGTIYMQQVPADPGGASSDYTYTSSATGDDYDIVITLEGISGGFQPGNVTASPAGMSQ